MRIYWPFVVAVTIAAAIARPAITTSDELINPISNGLSCVCPILLNIQSYLSTNLAELANHDLPGYPPVSARSQVAAIIDEGGEITRALASVQSTIKCSLNASLPFYAIESSNNGGAITASIMDLSEQYSDVLRSLSVLTQGTEMGFMKSLGEIAWLMGDMVQKLKVVNHILEVVRRG